MSVHNYSQDWSESLAAMMQHKISVYRSSRYGLVRLNLDDAVIISSSLEEHGERGIQQVEITAAKLAEFFQVDIEYIDLDLTETDGSLN